MIHTLSLLSYIIGMRMCNIKEDDYVSLWNKKKHVPDIFWLQMYVIFKYISFFFFLRNLSIYLDESKFYEIK